MKKKVTISIPKSLITTFGGVDWIVEGENAFHMNHNKGKKIAADDGLIVQSKKSSLMFVGTKHGAMRGTYTTTIEELESLLKLAKKRRNQFKKLADCFFIHQTPDLSFFFTSTKKKKD